MPGALLYGVPYGLFWHLNPRKLAPFRDAYQKKLEADNQNAWIQGQYIRLAVGSVLDGKKCKYPEEPFEFSDGQQDDEPDSAGFLNWISAYNAKFAEKEDAILGDS